MTVRRERDRRGAAPARAVGAAAATAVAKLRSGAGVAVGPQEQHGLRTSLVAGTFATLVANVGATVLNFSVTVVLTRSLDPGEFGAYAYALAWATLLVVPAGMGFPQLLVREVARRAALREQAQIRAVIRGSVRSVLLATLVATSVGGAIAYLLAAGEPDARRVLVVALALVPLVLTYRVAESTMRGLRRLVEGRLAETLVQPTVLITALLVAALVDDDELDPGVAMGLTVGAAAVAAVVSLVLLRRALPPRDAGAVAPPGRASYREARPLFVIAAAQILQAQAALIVLGASGAVRDSGAFSVALKWAMFVSFLQTAVNFAVAPVVTRLHVQGDRRRLQAVVTRATRGVTLASLPIALVLVVFPQQALAVFGSSFRSADTALLILVVGELVNVGCGSVGVTLTMTNHERDVARLTVAAMGLNVALGLALVPHLGLEGAAIAHATSLAALNVLLARRLWRVEGVYAPVVGGRRLRAAAAPMPSASSGAPDETGHG